MEALSASLQPYKGVIGSIASVVTIVQFFSGSLICKDIHNKKSTEGISSMPFVGGIVIGVLMIKYALMLEDSAMIVVNLAAIVLNAVYLVIYYAYSVNKQEEVHKPISGGIGLVAVLFGYISWEDPALIEYRYSLIITVLMLGLIGAPLLEVSEIVRKKDASSIPFPLVISGAVVCFLWLLYSIVLLNHFMFIQNVVGMLLCVIQVVLTIIYPGKSKIE